MPGTLLSAVEPAESTLLWWVFALVVVVVIAVGGVFLWLALRKTRRQEEPCKNCGRVLLPEWTHCMFCKAPRDMGAAALKFVAGPLAGRTLTLDEEVTTIGAAPENTILLSEGGVSRKHAGIRRLHGGYELADLGSTNGVYVNGEKVAKRMLVLGDVIRIGTTEIVFKV